MIIITEKETVKILSFAHPHWFICLEIQKGYYYDGMPSQVQSKTIEVNDVGADQKYYIYQLPLKHLYQHIIPSLNGTGLL